jgi:SH3 domain-containing YSC84-like protein 1
MKATYRMLLALIAIALIGSTVRICAADTKDTEDKRLENSGRVLSEIMNIPDNIPQDLLDRARCIVVIPSVLKAAFGIGGSYGRGAMICRTGHDFHGPWGAPSMMAIEGGSFGFQIGGQATDFVLLVMNDRGGHSLLHSKVTLGGDASAAAGPVGRDAEADTDAYMRAEILTYSRARGVFAGISLQGATLHPDNDGNEALYGQKISAEDIVFNHAMPVPPAADQLVSILEKASPRERAER